MRRRVGARLILDVSEGEIVIYKCMDSTCGFVFSRDFEPERCPSCGRDCIRPATEQEIAEFQRYIADGQTKKADGSRGA